MSDKSGTSINKKELSERDIRTKFITPAIVNGGWDLQNQIREEYFFTKGRITVQDKIPRRSERKFADYLLFFKPNIPLAIIEAKDNNHSIGDGMQQALAYSELFDVPFVYSSNGDGFIEHDKTIKEGVIEKEIRLDEFPSPSELWQRYMRFKGFSSEEELVVAQDYYYSDAKIPRYYQYVAVNKAIEAIAKGQNRLLLVMATGTGKTLAAFQLIYRLWKAKVKKRILFLADRNILVDQAIQNDFKPFGNKLTKVTHRQVDKSYEIYLALYQGLTGEEDWKNIYLQFSRDFFDLVVVDECHRGSAKVNSAWREILDYFSSAAQIGMTATPKETADVSNIEYFGEPVYIYSLKQGIDDGFLAPYKVIRVTLDKDLTGYFPGKFKFDKYGNLVEERDYGISDYDRNLVLEKRTALVAKKVSDYLKESNTRFDKIIFFCVDIEHAERMRQALVNENSDLVFENQKYVMRITGDNEEGKKQLDSFIDVSSLFPVLVTTSKLLTTGVDCQTVKNIVLDTVINSISEFKQIIGRGTRVREDYNKYQFTIMDFRGATRLFADPDFDGEPVKIKEGSDIPPDKGEPQEEPTEEEPKRNKYYINDVEVSVVNQRVLYLGKDGKLITEALTDFTRKAFLKEYRSLDDFLTKWNSSDRKEAIIEELRNQGILIDELQQEVGKDIDIFDLLCHVVYDKPPLTRRERANKVKKRNYFSKYGEKVQQVLDALLDKYADEGLRNIESLDILKIEPLNRFGSPIEIIDTFGGKERYLAAISELESAIYSS